MENYAMPLRDLMFIISLIVAVGSAVAIIRNIPIFKHEERIKTLEQHEKEQCEVQNALCHGVLSLLTHARTGNGIEEIKKAEKTLQDALIEK